MVTLQYRLLLGLQQLFRLLGVAAPEHGETGLGLVVLLERDAGLLRIELQRVEALLAPTRIVAVEEPAAGVHRQVLLAQVVAQVHAVGDAGQVGDDERGTVPGLGLHEGAQGMYVLGTGGDRGHVDVLVGHGDHAQVLLRGRLASGGELGHRAPGGRLGGLATGVGIDLGIQHQQVDVLARGQRMVQATEADVVGPAVAADDPDALAHQVVGDGEQPPRAFVVDAAQQHLQLLHPAPLFHDAGLIRLVGSEQVLEQLRLELVTQLGQQHLGLVNVLVDGKAEAQAELGIVLEQRVVPGRPPPFRVGRVGGGGQVPAVDGGAAGGIGDEHAVTEHLSGKTDVGRLAAAQAGAGELEQRLRQHRRLHLRPGHLAAIVLAELLEEGPVDAVLLQDLLLGHHVQRLVAGVALVPRRADIGTEAAAGAVVGRHLVGDVEPLELLAPHGAVAETLGCILELLLGEDLGADGRVGTDEGTLAALDAQIRIPAGQLQGDGALFPGGGAQGPGAVRRYLAHRQFITLTGDEGGGDFAHELRGLIGHRRPEIEIALHAGGQLHLVQVVQRRIDGGEVALHDLAPLASVGLLHRLLDLLDRLPALQYAGNGEEAGLHDGVDAPPHASAPGHLVGVDDPQLHLLLQHLLLQGARQGGPYGFGGSTGVEQEHATGSRLLQQVEALHELGLVATDEARLAIADQVAGANGTRTEAQVRNRHRTRLLGIVDEVALHELVRLLAEDLQGVLVGAHGAVGTQAVEKALHHPFHVPVARIGLPFQAGVAYIVVDADGEVVLRLRLLQVVEDCADHARRELLGGEAITATDDARQGSELLPATGHVLGKGADHILVERLAGGTRFLAAVQHGDGLRRSGDGRHQVFHRERPVEPYPHHAHLLALAEHVLHRLFHRLGPGPHEDHHPFGVAGTEVVEEVVVAARELRQLVHGLLDDAGQRLVVGVHRLPPLEVDIGVLRSATQHRPVRRERPVTVFDEVAGVHHGADGLVVDELHLHQFVGGAETIEEVDEGDLAAQGGGLGHQRRVHHLLHRAGGEHGEARGAGGHHVGMVAEDGERLGRDGTGSHVNHRGGQLAGDLVHVGDHQQQPLGGGEGGGEPPPPAPHRARHRRHRPRSASR